MDGIFISYRRDDTAGYAGRLYDRLAGHFGPSRVFMDVEGIELGTDFVTAIEEAVGSCRVLIVLMGDEWLNITDNRGRRRLDDPNDFIRLETQAALVRNVRVIPVLVEGAAMPAAADLPEELRPLTRRQAIEISHKQWEASTGELIHALEPLLQASPAPAPGASPEAAHPKPLDAPPTKAPIPSQPDEQRRGRPGPKWLPALGALLAVGLGTLGWLALRPEPTPAPTPEPPTEVTAAPAAPTPATTPSVATPTPTPTPAPSTPPASTPPATPPTPAPPAQAEMPKPPAKPAEPPSILAFNARVEGSKATLCYRVEGAESLTLVPRPGTLAQTKRACLTLPLREATTFTLKARGPGGQASSEPLAVAPEAIPASPPSPVATPTPAPTPAATAVAHGLPRVGDTWSYQTRGMWPTSPKRSLQFVVRASESAGVTEELRQLQPEGRDTERQRNRGAEPGFTGWTEIGSEFSPYLGGARPWSGDESWRDIPTPDFDINWRNWYSTAKVVGQETVQVPAGSYKAWKVEAWSARNATGGRSQMDVEPVRIRYLVWYAPQLARYVRMERRITSASSNTLELDVFELTAFRPAP